MDLVPEPQPGPLDVTVRVSACGICGSDLGFIAMGGISFDGGPMALGHEIAGVVEEVGTEVRDVSRGDRVIVMPGDPRKGLEGIIGNGGPEGGLTDLLLVRGATVGNRLYGVPDDMDLGTAALAEPVAVGMRAAHRSGARRGDTVAVFGCGPIGLAAIAALADTGASAVGVDLSRRRLDLAAAVGAAHTIDAGEGDVWARLRALHGSDNVMFTDVATTSAYVEATGSGAVLSQMIANCRPGARISVVAVHHAPVPIQFMSVMAKEVNIMGSVGYPERFEDAIELLRRSELPSIVTHQVDIDDIDQALAVLSGDKDCGKVLVTTGVAA